MIRRSYYNLKKPTSVFATVDIILMKISSATPRIPPAITQKLAMLRSKRSAIDPPVATDPCIYPPTYETISETVANAAEPMANPLPIAAVVFPTASSLSVMTRISGARWQDSARPPAATHTISSIVFSDYIRNVLQ